MSGEERPSIGLPLEKADLTARLTLPVRVRVQGMEAVLISASAYDKLLQAGARSPGALSRVDRDPELKAFIEAHIDTEEMKDIRALAVERFGADRVPSISSLSRYAVARRVAAQAVTGRGRRR